MLSAITVVKPASWKESARAAACRYRRCNCETASSEGSGVIPSRPLTTIRASTSPSMNAARASLSASRRPIVLLPAAWIPVTITTAGLLQAVLIVGSDHRRGSCGTPLVFAFDLDAVHEGGAGADERDQVGRVDAAPSHLGGLQQLVGHGQSGAPAARALGLVGPQSDRRERRLDGVRTAQVDPVLGWVREVGEQDLAVLEQPLGRLLVLGPVRLLEAVHGRLGGLLVLGVHDLVQRPPWPSAAGSWAARRGRGRSCAPSSAAPRCPGTPRGGRPRSRARRLRPPA